ncbi:MAG: DMT family transporter, partial [Peptostreptococcus sp.]|nr:DMT family transporter [Peptostreptococcus sp.]
MTNKKKMHILAMTTILFWALAFPASKIAMKHYNPFSLAFLRVTIASCVLLIIGKATGIRPPKKEDLVWFLLSGACGFDLSESEPLSALYWRASGCAKIGI